MTHPGQPGTPPSPTGGPQPGPQTPPGRSAAWGPQQPGAQLFGGPQPGAPAGSWGRLNPGMPPAPDLQPGGQPAVQPGADVPPAAPARRSRGARLGVLIGAVVIAGGVAAVDLGGVGAPEVGDCVQRVGVSFETVDCGDADADVRIVGVVDDAMSEDEFDDPTVDPCTDFPEATAALWQQDVVGTDGTVYCAEGV
ncbi:LppU/SCO3897 family protein [Geodermatophilus sp. URMC 63]